MNSTEINRYQRHFNLPNFSEKEQTKLLKAKVLVIGAGGLGAPLLQYLNAVGVGTIGIVDFDRVEKSNLHRQVLFGDEDLGKLKVEVAIKKLSKQNPLVNFVGYPERLTTFNALEIIAKYDLVADGTDNFPTRYLVNDACVISGKTNVYASIFRFEGQVSVFNYLGNKENPNYRDLYPKPPAPNSIPNCADAGVLGVLPGIVGSMQANEVIKVITGLGVPMVGKLFVFDALAMQSRKIAFSKDDSIPPIRELIDYDSFCGLNLAEEELIFQEELKLWINSEYPFYLVDVRTKDEHATDNIGGVNIPLEELEARSIEIKQADTVVLYCQKGVKSMQAFKILQPKLKEKRLLSLKEGIEKWD